MGDIFKQFQTDTIKVISKNGEYASQEFKAMVSGNKIDTTELDIEVSEGDIIERILPGGKIESYIISESVYKSAYSTIPASYTFKVKKL